MLIGTLLDKARDTCSLATDAALAERLGVTRQTVSQWRSGAKHVADDRIAQLARLAHEDAGSWLVQIHAEQAGGEAAKAWSALAKRLAAAAACVMVAAGLQLSPAPAAAQAQHGETLTGVYIMRIWRWLRRHFIPTPERWAAA